MTTLLQRNKCNFWHLQKLFMWVWVQSWKKQEGCGDSTCGINCNHKRWIPLSPLYFNYFTKSRPDNNKNSNFPGIRHLLFWSFTRWQTPPPCCGCAAWRLIHHPAIFWKLEAMIVNCTIEFFNVDKNVCLVKPSPSSQYLLYYDTARRLC